MITRSTKSKAGRAATFSSGHAFSTPPLPGLNIQSAVNIHPAVQMFSRGQAPLIQLPTGRTLHLDLAGASGTGKSTLASTCAMSLGLSQFNPDARLILNGHNWSIDDIAKPPICELFHLSILFAYSVAVMNALVAERPLICPRSPIDILTYHQVYDPDSITEKEIDIVSGLLASVTHICYVPLSLGQWLDGDPVRSSDPEFHKRYDATLKDNLELFCAPNTPTGPKLITLQSATLAERYSEVVKHICQEAPTP